MDRMLKVCALLTVLAFPAFAQIPNVTIKQIQQVPLDSLLKADTLQGPATGRWTLQVSPYYLDTVTITAICVVPAYPRIRVGDSLGVITFTQRGWTMLLADTGANPYPWGGLLVRIGNASDTSQAELDGFLDVQRGDRVRITGRIDEFPSGNLTSLSQFVPIPGRPIVRVGTAPVPGYVRRPVGEYYTGVFPSGKIRYSTGEQWEGCLIDLETPLTVDAKVNTGRGTFSVVDGSGNQITDYDGSKYFTLKGTSVDHPDSDRVWKVVYPALTVPTGVDTLRGFITTVSGSEAPRGYRISPLYRLPHRPGDVKFGVILPTVTTHRRNPIVVPPDSTARISVRVTRQTGGFPIASVNLYYSLNNGAFINLPMTMTRR